MLLIAQGLVFDWTISLGQIVNAVLLVIGFGYAVMKLYHALDKRVSIFERDMTGHAKTLADHAVRMERWESTLFKVVADLQRVIGRMEVQQNQTWDGRTERRTEPGRMT